VVFDLVVGARVLALNPQKRRTTGAVTSAVHRYWENNGSIVVALSAGTSAALIAAAPAHSDANSYLAYIHANGINTGLRSDAKIVSGGLQVLPKAAAGVVDRPGRRTLIYGRRSRVGSGSAA
jgi:hypothetical protein